MNNNLPCDGDWLVEYADAGPSHPGSLGAKQHLQGCAGCRRQLAALQSSGRLIEEYFGALRQPSASPPVPARHHVSYWTTTAAVAGTALVMALLLTLGWRWRDTHTASKPETAAALSVREAVIAEIEREERIARLQAMIDILAREPRLEQQSMALKSYLQQNYSVDTPDSPSL